MVRRLRPVLLAELVAITLVASACNSEGFSGGSGKVEPVKNEESKKPATKPKKEESLGKEKEGDEIEVPSTQPKPPSPQPQPEELDNDVVTTTPTPQPQPPVVTPQPQPEVPPPVVVTPPSSDTEVGVLRFKVIPFVNMEHRTHATEVGAWAFVKSSSGNVVAAGPMTVEAACRGENLQSMGYPVVRLKVGLKYLAPQVSNGQMAGQQQGTLSICLVNNANNPDSLSCQKVAPRVQFVGQSGDGFGDRPAFWYDRPVSFTINGTEINIENKAGFAGTGMGLYGGSEGIEGGLTFAHPLQAPTCGSSARNYADYNSPLVIDTNRSGALDLKNVWEDGPSTRFDIRGDGQKIRTGWINGDSLLVLDLNGNGQIDSGKELFGEHSHLVSGEAKSQFSTFANGFQALAQYDLNHDGRIDEKDGVYSKLMLWNDKNGDGVSQKNELVPLASQVKSVSLAYSKVSAPEGSKQRFFMVQMNEVRFAATVQFNDGKSGEVADVWFAARSEQTAQAGDVK